MTDPVRRAESFRSLHAEVYPDLVRFVQRRADPGHIDDVVSEALLVWWRRFDEAPRGVGDARAWVFTVARQVLLNHRRTEQRRDALAVRVATVVSAGPASPAEAVINRIELARAWRLLSPQQQEALALVVFEGLDTRRAAAILDISPSAFRLRVSRARRTLRHHLAGRAAVPDTSATSDTAAALPEERTATS